VTNVRVLGVWGAACMPDDKAGFGAQHIYARTRVILI